MSYSKVSTKLVVKIVKHSWPKGFWKEASFETVFCNKMNLFGITSQTLIKSHLKKINMWEPRVLIVLSKCHGEKVQKHQVMVWYGHLILIPTRFMVFEMWAFSNDDNVKVIYNEYKLDFEQL